MFKVPSASTYPENVKKNNPVIFFGVSLSLQACEKLASQISLPPWCRKWIYYNITAP